MKNISVFAHFDKDNIIDDYVIYYLQALRAVSEKIIFVSDCDLDERELLKLDGIADFYLAQKHGEYDFGSYKRGWKIALENGLLADADTLTFANDSCYGPFYSLAPLYDEMNARGCDFWGITGNRNFLEGNFYPCPESNDRHVQSYFMVFKKTVFETEVFAEFMKSIKKEDDKLKIIEKYEIGLSRLLCQTGFGYNVIFDEQIGNINIECLKYVKKQPHMFMKKSLLKETYFIFLIRRWLIYLNLTSKYPVNIMLTHLKKTRKITDFKIEHINNFKYVRRKLLRIHWSEGRIFILGCWYSWRKSRG